jgi:hypothetical protein
MEIVVCEETCFLVRKNVPSYFEGQMGNPNKKSAKSKQKKLISESQIKIRETQT